MRYTVRYIDQLLAKYESKHCTKTNVEKLNETVLVLSPAFK